MSTTPAAHAVVGGSVAFEAAMVDETGAVIDVRSASTREIHFLKPGGATSLVKPASVSNPGLNDGKIVYATAPEVPGPADLDVAGWWCFRGYVIVSGKVYPGASIPFEVKPRY